LRKITDLLETTRLSSAIMWLGSQFSQFNAQRARHGREMYWQRYLDPVRRATARKIAVKFPRLEYRNEARLLSCFEDLIDREAYKAWTEAVSAQPVASDEWRKFRRSFHERVDLELRKRAVFLKELVRDSLLSLYLLQRHPPEKAGEQIPGAWARFAPSSSTTPQTSLRERKGEKLSSSFFEQSNFNDSHFQCCDFTGVTRISEHFDHSILEECTFDHSNFSNCSFEGSRFVKCRIRDTILRNTNFTSAEFEECELERIDLGGSVLDRTRFWYPTRYREVRADSWTSVELPLIDERECSFELAALNYRMFAEMFAGSGIPKRASTLVYHEQTALVHTLPYGARRIAGRLNWILTGSGERPVRFATVVFSLVLVWGFLYWVFGLATVGIKPASLLESIYFSISVFTTLGLGDVQPIRSVCAQMLAGFEVVGGVIGIAVLTALVVARMFRR
jgi:hypothetical protein